MKVYNFEAVQKCFYPSIKIEAKSLKEAKEKYMNMIDEDTVEWYDTEFIIMTSQLCVKID